MTRYSTHRGPCFYLATSRSPHRALAAAAFSAALAAALPVVALAQGAKSMEEVLITGSFIKSTGEDEASPVEVLDDTYIENSGAVNIVELTSRLAVNSGSENNADSFTAGETQGTANVNLRGLGLTSTLVLINGKRQTLAAAVANDGSVFVDTNTVPFAALERVEILKEGATATYGSDAIAGVVNFILKDDFSGFQLDGGYQSTASGGQTNTGLNALAGFELGARTRALFSASLMQQQPLASVERPYTTENALSTLGRSFIALGAGRGTGAYAGPVAPRQTIPDPNCAANGGPLIASNNRCGFLYGPRFNLVNEESSYQLYGNLTHEFSAALTLSAELGWSHHEVKDNPQSPSYPNLGFPRILPGQAGSPFDVPVVWLGRPLGSEAPSPFAPRESDTLRASLDLEGRLGSGSGWDWYAALTYSANERSITQPDTVQSRLEAALAGRGGPNGTETFSPFDPAANSRALIDYISVATLNQRKTALLVGDVVFSGELFERPAGAVAAAFGAQWRHEAYRIDPVGVFEKRLDPATGQPIPVDLIFLGGALPIDESRSAYALFAEASVPLGASLELDLALRYEDLDTDSSVDPKIALRWQATDDLVLRASASSAFREPSLQQIYSQGTSLEGLVDPLNPGSAVFVRVDTAGSRDLRPEESTNVNLGAIWSPTDDLSLRLDYWRFDYKDVIVAEDAQGKLNDEPNGPDVNRLSGAGSQLQGITTNYINASSVETDGIDLAVDWRLPSGRAGQFGAHLTATHFLSYVIPCTGPNARGCAGASGTQDVVGFFNYDTFVRSMPATKLNASLDWTRGPHRVALLGFYTSSYATTRPVDPRARSLGYTRNIDSWLTVDVQYAYAFKLAGAEAVLTLGSKNLFDEEAPRAYDGVNFSFDPKHHDPRGRLWYGGIKVDF